MTTYSIDQLAVLAGGTLHQGSPVNAPIRYLLYDRRKLAHPSETLFVAIRTSRNDGHFFIPALYANGVRNFLVEVITTSNHHDIGKEWMHSSMATQISQNFNDLIQKIEEPLLP